jgi:hypothetical protein
VQDYTQALQWWRLAAEQGEPLAQNGVGWIYLNCLGVKCDSREAAIWFRKSAEQSCSTAQRNLGYILEHGKGVSVDYPEALKWYRLAAESGNGPAETSARSLAGIMTKKQLNETELRVVAWKQRNRTIAESAMKAGLESHD